MAKKKSIKETDIFTWYMDFVLEHNHAPKSVYAFAKENNFDEALFYQYFGSFKAVEGAIFKAFFDNTLVALSKSEDYQNFDARNKLLSFYFTFFENLTANRSYVMYALGEQKDKLKSLIILKDLKVSFSEYVESLGIETLDLKQEQLEKIKERGIKETAWFQLLVTIKFWMDDESASFEKTDIFIEKSLTASFDLIDTTPLKSIIDFGKFIFKERVQMK